MPVMGSIPMVLATAGAGDAVTAAVVCIKFGVGWLRKIKG